MKVKMNVLPVITWRYLGVNDDEVTIGNNYPKNVVHRSIKNKNENIRNITDEDIKNIEPLFEKVENGIATEWMDEHFKYQNDGIYLSGSKEDKTIFIDYKAEKGSIFSEHNVLYAKEGEKIHLVINYDDFEEDTYLSSVTRIVAEKNADVRIIKIHNANEIIEGVDVVTALVHEDANVEVISVEMGGEHMLTNYQLELLEDNSNGNIETIYFGKNDEIIDLAYRINHYGKDARSHIECNGVLKDKSKKTFKGTLDFKKGSSGSKGAESETATLLDKTVHNRSIPSLLCSEDDVEGDHAASAGRLDESMMFYLMSRGFDYDEAKRMLIFAKLTPTIKKIPDDEMMKKVYAYLESSLE